MFAKFKQTDTQENRNLTPPTAHYISMPKDYYDMELLHSKGIEENLNLTGHAWKMFDSSARESTNNFPNPIGSILPHGRALNVKGRGEARIQSVELSAKIHHGSAASSRPMCIWSGAIHHVHHERPVYSCKIFLGGVPWDITEVRLRLTFAKFGELNVARPKKIGIAGHLYLEFKHETSVHFLLDDCRKDNGNHFYKVPSEEKPFKEVQVIPWVLSEAEKLYRSVSLDNYPYTVYVGALHGMMTAQFLGDVMSDIFGEVVYAGIDTDKYNKYPIGSGRVTFTTYGSFIKAVEAEFVEIRTQKFTKKIQIEPYLVESMCGYCESSLGTLFCRDLSCFNYFCSRCWYIHHTHASRQTHQPICRKCQ